MLVRPAIASKPITLLARNHRHLNSIANIITKATNTLIFICVYVRRQSSKMEALCRVYTRRARAKSVHFSPSTSGNREADTYNF